MCENLNCAYVSLLLFFWMNMCLKSETMLLSLVNRSRPSIGQSPTWIFHSPSLSRRFWASQLITLQPTIINFLSSREQSTNYRTFYKILDSNTIQFKNYFSYYKRFYLYSLIYSQNTLKTICKANLQLIYSQLPC